MSFIEDLPDYKSYRNDHYHMTKIPDKKEMWDALQAYAHKAAEAGEADDERYFWELVVCLNDLVLLPPTSNTGYSWLVDDLKKVFSTLRNKVNEGEISLFFDAIAIIVDKAKLDVDKINVFLDQYEIGYELLNNFRWYNWIVKDNIEKLTDNLDNTLIVVSKSGFEQALEHLQQAKLHFENPTNERSLKDAIRDCASAMESIITILGEDDNIRIASKNLRNLKSWGRDEIVKDGDAIFNKLHDLYPDFRHGSTGMSTMTTNEAKYWADRMVCFIDYLLRQKKELSV